MIAIWIFSATLSLMSKADDTSVADAFYEQGECEKAIPLYFAIISKNGSAELKDHALFQKAYCHYALGQFEEAVSNFKRYIDHNPLAGEATFRLAESLYQ